MLKADVVFPTIVYRAGGSWVGPPVDGKSTTFATKPIANAADLDAALFAGWFLTVPEAVDPSQREPEPVANAPVAAQDAPSEAPSDEPATREGLLAEAKALGLKVDGRWSDARLAAEIEKAKG